MAPLSLESAVKIIDLSKCNGPTNAKVVVVPLPKNTVGILFGTMTATWAQRFNTYLLNSDNIVLDPQVVWDAVTDKSRFNISQVVPQSAAQPDPNVFSVGPYTDDRNIAVYCSHLKPGSSKFSESDPKHTFKAFKIGNSNAISFTMINAEDGGDTNYHDTVVGIAVTYMYVQ